MKVIDPAIQDHPHSKILLIGLDATDWDLLSEKIAAGKLPNLAKLMKRGASGPLRSLRPLFSPALWATISTGKRPYQHNITGFILPTSSGKGLHTYDSSSRSSPAIWEILSSAHQTSHVVGWWNSAPAEKIRGVMVDETFRVAQFPCNIPWEVKPSSVTPSSLAEKLAKCRCHPQQLSTQLLQRLIPKLYEIDPTVDWRVSAIAKILAEDLTTLQTTLCLMKEHPWNFTTLYLIGLDSFSHQGTSFREPTTGHADELGIEHYGELIDRSYDLYDEWIGELVAAAGEETTIMLVSDHGFYHDDRKPHSLGINTTAPCDQHAPIGTLIIAGPNIKEDSLVTHASLLDVCPTLLALSGLPIGRDMKGNVLSEIFKNPLSVHTIPSWDQVVSRPAKKQLQEPCEQATNMALRQLIALGYLPQAPLDHQHIFSTAHTDHLLYEALSYLENDRIDAAMPLLERAHHNSPERTDILTTLAECYRALGSKEQASAALKQFVFHRVRDAWQAYQALQTKNYDPHVSLSTMEILEWRHLTTRAQLDPTTIDFARLFADWLINPEEQIAQQLYACAEFSPKNFSLVMQAADICFFHGWNEQALALLHTLATWKKEESSPLVAMAAHQNEQGHFEQAVALSQEALKRHPLDHAAWLELGKALAAQHKWSAARTAARQAASSFLKRPQAYKLLATIALQEEKNKELARIFHPSLLRKPGSPMAAALDLNFDQDSMDSYSPDKNPSSALPHQPSRLSRHESDERSGLEQRYTKLAEHATKRLTKLKNSLSGSSLRFLHHQNRSLSTLTSTEQGISKHPSTQQPIIVTGLPRSGTSLLMQMLTAGGIDAITDYKRLPDQHNPLGYFEHEKFKEIANHTHLLEPGKAAKIVIPLLWELPQDLNCHIIWIRRALEEVITSQHRMAGEIASFEDLKQAYVSFEVQTSEIIRQRPWSVLQLSHTQLLADPMTAARKINDFLGGLLDIKAMAAIVEPSLHRCHST